MEVVVARMPALGRHVDQALERELDGAGLSRRDLHLLPYWLILEAPGQLDRGRTRRQLDDETARRVEVVVAGDHDHPVESVVRRVALAVAADNVGAGLCFLAGVRVAHDHTHATNGMAVLEARDLHFARGTASRGNRPECEFPAGVRDVGQAAAVGRPGRRVHLAVHVGQAVRVGVGRVHHPQLVLAASERGIRNLDAVWRPDRPGVIDRLLLQQQLRLFGLRTVGPDATGPLYAAVVPGTVAHENDGAAVR